MKDIVCFDVETTGLNSKEDFIIQLAAIKFDRNTFEIKDKKNWYIIPQHAYIISPSAQKVHGITKEFLEKNGTPLKSIAPEFLTMCKDCDILSYNGNTFDLKFIAKDFKLAGYEFDFSGRKFYDSYAMECRMNPRDLSSVFKKYTGKEFEDAHNAFSDVSATISVFEHQMKDCKLTYDEIDQYEENNLLSPENSIRNAAAASEPMKIVFSFGKYKDSEFMEIIKKDPGYIKWFMENIASDYTKNILRDYYKKNRLN